MPVAIETAATLQSIDPATGEVVGEVPITLVEQIPAIIQKARAAQRRWAKLTLQQRAEAIAPAQQALLDRTSELATLITREMGKPIKDATGEVKGYSSGLADTLKEITEALQPDTLEDENTKSIIYREPLGVCAAITPWNFPLGMPFEAIIPALMAGNAVIVKPSEETPLIAQALVDILNENLPEGLLQIVHGADAQGKALVAAEGIDLIAFTGSREAGKHILGAASKTLKRVILELGGKDPMIVLDDADIEAAAKFAVRNSFRNSGQVCVSTERIYVDAKIAEQFEKRVAELASVLKIGPGMQEGNDLGPMVNNRQKQWVLKQVGKAQQQGAKVVLGEAQLGGTGVSPVRTGGTPVPPEQDNFVRPIVLSNLNHDMDIMREETFGPVACIARFKSIEEAIDLANDTPYGLGACVFGKDEQRAADVARRLEAGMIGVNKSCGGASGSPWVGAKQSGYGWHSGKEGHRQFTQPRVVSVPKAK